VDNVLLVGRWQVPKLHQGHKELIRTVIREGYTPVVAIRKTERNLKNPYSVSRRKRIIRRAFPKIKIVVIPDIAAVAVGRDVGYKVIRLSDEIERVSGSEIRRRLSNDSVVDRKQRSR